MIMASALDVDEHLHRCCRSPMPDTGSYPSGPGLVLDRIAGDTAGGDHGNLRESRQSEHAFRREL